jgi:hypothetical protein
MGKRWLTVYTVIFPGLTEVFGTVTQFFCTKSVALSFDIFLLFSKQTGPCEKQNSHPAYAHCLHTIHGLLC